MNDNTAVTRTSEAAHREGALLPPVDVIEDARGIILYADLPGVPKEKLNLQVEDNSLIISGDLALDMPEGMEASHADVSQPRYRRVFTLSRDLDLEQASAEFANGELTLRIPKAAHAQPRRIEVRAA
ncbi:Hsp20/alpha crystallin family protein [Accumulibacter sp.]|uniref:Hsp20/alpha crystallin family protein n=1 Tax=Accumulibacter sp. TaxID=2053492 RepID=UPI001D2E9E49|nr:Hsp20/alpha crystallin family protein [Accumulibacter sp.]MCB1964698.1 Hsp20/alpha crystallin family protein [Accumulibacter sp.]MCP5227055.1 Hsp20/alpha crystallin family protein [Accumulibacter sp.]